MSSVSRSGDVRVVDADEKRHEQDHGTAMSHPPDRLRSAAPAPTNEEDRGDDQQHGSHGERYDDGIGTFSALSETAS